MAQSKKTSENTLYYQLPLFFEEGEFVIINEKLEQTQGWRLESRFDLEIKFNSLKFLSVNVENVFLDDALLKTYSYNNEIIGTKLFNDVFLEFSFKPPEDSKSDTEEHDISNSEIIPFKVKNIFLHIFSNGIGFITFQIEIEDHDLLKFNGSFDIVFSRFEGRNDTFFYSLPRKIYKLDRRFLKPSKKLLQDIKLNKVAFPKHPEISGFSIEDFANVTRTKSKFNTETKKKEITQWGNYFYLSHVISVILGNVDELLKHELTKSYLKRCELFKLSLYKCETIDSLFFKQFASFRTTSENFSEIQDENIYAPMEQVQYSFLSQGGTVYLGGDNPVNSAIYDNRELYFYIATICQLQKNSFQKIFYDISNLSRKISTDKSVNVKDLIRELDKINLYFLTSYTQFWFSDISNHNQINNYYNYWQKTLDLDKDYNEIKSELALLNEYLERASKKRINTFTNIITFFLFPITIMAGLLGVNIAELGSGTRSLFSFQSLFVIGLSIFLPGLIWLYVRKK